MFSNLIITQNKFVLFVDNVGLERYSTKFLQGWMNEQSQNNCMYLNSDTLDCSFKIILKKFQEELHKTDKKLNIILPPLSNLLVYQNSSTIFQLINNLKKNSQIKQIFLWATTKNISEHFVVPFLEYMADLIVTFKDLNYLSVLTRKIGGLVSNNNFLYRTEAGQFLVESIKNNVNQLSLTSKTNNSVIPQNLGTFKIDLDEEELVARNALKLPYEKTQVDECNIIYTPDAEDDFDDEDPDEDLYI